MAIFISCRVIAEQFHVSNFGFSNSFWSFSVWNIDASFGHMVGFATAWELWHQIWLTLVQLVFSYSSGNWGYARDIVWSLHYHCDLQVVARNFATILATDALSGALVPMAQDAMETLIAQMWCTDEERNFPLLSSRSSMYLASQQTGALWQSSLLDLGDGALYHLVKQLNTEYSPRCTMPN